MTHRYFALSENARLNEEESLWIPRSNWIKVPQEAFEHLLSIFNGYEPEKGETLGILFLNTFNESYDLLIDDEYYLAPPAEIKFQWIASLQLLSRFVEAAESNVIELFLPVPKWYYDNDEYISMIDAVIRFIEESIRLDEPVQTWLDK